MSEPAPAHSAAPRRQGDGAPAPAQASDAPLGILAGGGSLPLEIAAAAEAAGRPVHIVAIDGFAGEGVARHPHTRVNLGQAGGMLAALRAAGCRDLVIAGSLERPNLFRLRFDWGAIRRIGVLLSLTRGGDDSVLRRVVRFFEGEGLRVVGAADVAPHLLASPGAMGARRPDSAADAAIARAARLIADLGPFDVGQAVVANADGIVAVEGVRGTDGVLRDLAPGDPGEGLGRGGVLVKLAKPGQEMRVDLPAVGPATIAGATRAGLAGIAVGAGAAIVLERAQTAAAADAAGLFLLGADAAASGRAAGGPAVAPPSDAILAVLARRAPTPADRRDIAVARRLLPVLAAHGAGPAAVIAREHVLAIPARLPVDRAVTALGRGASWGRRVFKREIGILAIDVADPARPGALRADALPGVEVFRAALASGLAGIVCLGAPIPEDRLKEMVPWADEARVFLMGEAAAAPATVERP